MKWITAAIAASAVAAAFVGSASAVPVPCEVPSGTGGMIWSMCDINPSPGAPQYTPYIPPGVPQAPVMPPPPSPSDVFKSSLPPLPKKGTEGKNWTRKSKYGMTCDLGVDRLITFIAPYTLDYDGEFTCYGTNVQRMVLHLGIDREYIGNQYVGTTLVFRPGAKGGPGTLAFSVTLSCERDRPLARLQGWGLGKATSTEGTLVMTDTSILNHAHC